MTKEEILDLLERTKNTVADLKRKAISNSESWDVIARYYEGEYAGYKKTLIILTDVIRVIKEG